MNICVCGWYGREFDEFYMTLYKVNKKHPVLVVAKRESSFWKQMELNYTVIENVGLEWAAYNYFVMSCWRGGDTLFLHDDIEILPIIQKGETVPPETLFDKLAEIDFDQAYLFGNRGEDVFNHGQHGRGLFCSHGLIDWLKAHGGIWCDEDNRGYTGGKRPDNSKALHYNAGTETFNRLMIAAKDDGFNTRNKVYVPALRMAHRGKIKNMEDMI